MMIGSDASHASSARDLDGRGGVINAAMRFEPRPRLVLFDLDNTICDYTSARRARTRYAFEPHFANAERLELAVTSALAEATDDSEHFGAVLNAHGVVDVEAVAAARARYIEDRFRGLHLYDDALAVVARVAQAARVGIITNGPADIQRPKIERLAIASHFPLIIVSGEAGVWKPDPAIFRIALEETGVTADAAIYVGDSAVHDVPGAQAAGLRAVWINRAGVPWPGGRSPDAEIRDLHGLLPLLGLEPLA